MHTNNSLIRRRRAIELIALSCGSALLASCGPKAKPATNRPPNWPDVLRLGYVHSEDLAGEREQALAAMARELERGLGLPVQLVATAAYAEAVNAFAERRIDLMRLSALTYLLAHEQAGAEAIVAYAPGEGEPFYHSALITHPDSGITDTADLPNAASNARFLYNDPASLSGYLVPKAFLKSQGIDPRTDFSSSGYSYSHYASIFSVAARRADLAAVSLPRLERLIEDQKIRSSEIVVLWRSAPLPWGTIAIRSALPADLKDRVQNCLVTLRERDPRAWQIVLKQHDDQSIRYHVARDADFDELRAMRSRIEASSSHGE